MALFSAVPVAVASNLPDCPSDTSAFWHNCFGTITFANGDKYVGEFSDNERHGQGTFTFANGNKYVGELRDGDFNGQGTFTFASGAKYVGEFRDDNFNGFGVTYDADGTILNQGIWKDDEFQYAQHSPSPSSPAS